jgi:hypothetical protein
MAFAVVRRMLAHLSAVVLMVPHAAGKAAHAQRSVELLERECARVDRIIYSSLDIWLRARFVPRRDAGEGASAGEIRRSRWLRCRRAWPYACCAGSVSCGPLTRAIAQASYVRHACSPQHGSLD